MSKRLLPVVGALAVALATSGLAVAGAATSAAAAERPSPITSVESGPGPSTGSITIRWRSAGRHTDRFRIETGLSMFSKTDPKLAYDGRHKRVFTVPGARRSVTLSRRQVEAAGATVSSAQHLYFRLSAVNDTATGAVVRPYPHLKAAQPRPLAAQGSVPIRVASFNVRTVSRGDTGDRAWANRVTAVADTILSRRPGVVGLQELSPSPITGRTGDTRQTVSLLRALHARGGRSYSLVRTTNYARGGTTRASQGARIAYDTDRYRLLSHCPDTTTINRHPRPFNGSCRFLLPVRPDDPDPVPRIVAFAQLQDKRTGTRFWVVSAHLYPDHSRSPALLNRQERQRARQAASIAATMNAMNTAGLPIVLAGDLNSWQTTTAYRPHNQLVDAGYYDTAAAVTRVRQNYATTNRFDTRVDPSPQGFGARLDVVLVKGSRGATRFETVVKRVDAHRASDHNMVVADFRLPR